MSSDFSYLPPKNMPQSVYGPFNADDWSNNDDPTSYFASLFNDNNFTGQNTFSIYPVKIFEGLYVGLNAFIDSVGNAIFTSVQSATADIASLISAEATIDTITSSTATIDTLAVPSAATVNILNAQETTTGTMASDSFSAESGIVTSLTCTTLSATTFSTSTANMTYVTADVAMVNANEAIAGSLSVAGQILCGDTLVARDVVFQNLKATSGAFSGPLRHKGQLAAILNVTQMSLPLTQSFTTSAYGGTLNVGSLLGSTGNNASIAIMPGYRAMFLASDGTSLVNVDNSSGDGPLYSAIVFTTGVNCTAIQVFYKQVMI